jgi:hypothetical protein
MATDFLSDVVENFPELDFASKILPSELLDIKPSCLRIQCSDDLIRMVETRPGQISSLRGFDCPSLGQIMDRNTGLRKLKIKPSSYLDTFAIEYSPDVKSAELSEPIPVMVSAICEPLKVRLITKGDAFSYWISKFYQKSLWSHLQKFPQFTPTGRPLCKTDLIDLLYREKRLGLIFPNWVSGDYSAATDGISINFTKHAFEASIKATKKSRVPGYTDSLFDVLRRVIYEQEVNYPTKSGIPSVRQRNGQLMGSTLSFPLLCLINRLLCCLS